MRLESDSSNQFGGSQLVFKIEGVIWVVDGAIKIYVSSISFDYFLMTIIIGKTMKKNF